jgi:predicted TIM-barrel fold metal-dependent hydrolase
MDYRLVSADDHMDLNYLPKDLWAKRLPRKWQADAPRVVESGGAFSWVAEGQRLGFYGTRRGTFISTFDRAGLPEEPEPGVFRPASGRYRLQDMDRDGIEATVIYGPPAHMAFKDLALKSACLAAYNAWAAEELCAYDPKRLLGIANLPVHDPQAAVQETHHAAKLGLAGVMFDVYHAVERVGSRIWDPLWSLAEETGLIVSFHTGGGMYSVKTAPGSWEMMATVTVLPLQLDEAIANVVFSGALERHPKLKIVVAESGIGWLPYLIERMDYEHKRYYDTVTDHRNKSLPSELFRRQLWVSFEDDPVGTKMVPMIGEDRVMWASDYPHGDTTFPRSVEVVHEMFAGVDARITRKVVRENAARLYEL